MIRTRRRPEDEGFTLIELLVVVVIIGVLIAIAIPLYSNYKKGAQNASAESDVKNAIVAVQQYYTSNGTYPATAESGTDGNNISLTATGSTGTASAGTDSITVGEGNQLSYKNNSSYFVICGQNSNGKTIYYYNSQSSKSVAKSTAASLTACAATA